MGALVLLASVACSSSGADAATAPTGASQTAGAYGDAGAPSGGTAAGSSGGGNGMGHAGAPIGGTGGAGMGGTSAAGTGGMGGTSAAGTGGGDIVVGGASGQLPPGYVPLQITPAFFEVNPRAEQGVCSAYDTSESFRTFFRSQEYYMSLVPLLFNRVMGRDPARGSPILSFEIRAFDYDSEQGQRDSCIEVSSPGEQTRGTTYGSIVDGESAFVDYEPDPANYQGFALLAHELLHALSLGHDPDGDGIMAPVIYPEDRCLDQFVVDSLDGAGITLVDDLPQRIAAGEKIKISTLIQTYLGVAVAGDDFTQ